MKDTDWPKCFNYNHKDPFPKHGHDCRECKKAVNKDERLNIPFVPGNWCKNYKYTDTPMCTKNCAKLGQPCHLVGCEIERWANYNYCSGRYDDHVNNQRADYNNAILITHRERKEQFVPPMNILRPISKAHRIARINRSKHYKILRGKILRPAFKLNMRDPLDLDNVCIDCAFDKKGFYEGSPCYDCQVVIHTRPTNFKKIKKGGK
jgi:hypothetical protein